MARESRDVQPSGLVVGVDLASCTCPQRAQTARAVAAALQDFAATCHPACQLSFVCFDGPDLCRRPRGGPSGVQLAPAQALTWDRIRLDCALMDLLSAASTQPQQSSQGSQGRAGAPDGTGAGAAPSRRVLALAQVVKSSGFGGPDCVVVCITASEGSVLIAPPDGGARRPRCLMIDLSDEAADSVPGIPCAPATLLLTHRAIAPMHFCLQACLNETFGAAGPACAPLPHHNVRLSVAAEAPATRNGGTAARDNVALGELVCTPGGLTVTGRPPRDMHVGATVPLDTLAELLREPWGPDVALQQKTPLEPFLARAPASARVREVVRALADTATCALLQARGAPRSPDSGAWFLLQPLTHDGKHAMLRPLGAAGDLASLRIPERLGLREPELMDLRASTSCVAPALGVGPFAGRVRRDSGAQWKSSLERRLAAEPLDPKEPFGLLGPPPSQGGVSKPMRAVTQALQRVAPAEAEPSAVDLRAEAAALAEMMAEFEARGGGDAGVSLADPTQALARFAGAIEAVGRAERGSVAPGAVVPTLAEQAVEAAVRSMTDANASAPQDAARPLWEGTAELLRGLGELDGEQRPAVVAMLAEWYLGVFCAAVRFVPAPKSRAGKAAARALRKACGMWLAKALQRVRFDLKGAFPAWFEASVAGPFAKVASARAVLQRAREDFGLVAAQDLAMTDAEALAVLERADAAAVAAADGAPAPSAPSGRSDGSAPAQTTATGTQGDARGNAGALRGRMRERFRHSTLQVVRMPSASGLRGSQAAQSKQQTSVPRHSVLFGAAATATARGKDGGAVQGANAARNAGDGEEVTSPVKTQRPASAHAVSPEQRGAAPLFVQGTPGQHHSRAAPRNATKEPNQGAGWAGMGLLSPEGLRRHVGRRSLREADGGGDAAQARAVHGSPDAILASPVPATALGDKATGVFSPRRSPRIAAFGSRAEEGVASPGADGLFASPKPTLRMIGSPGAREDVGASAGQRTGRALFGGSKGASPEWEGGGSEPAGPATGEARIADALVPMASQAELASLDAVFGTPQRAGRKRGPSRHSMSSPEREPSPKRPAGGSRRTRAHASPSAARSRDPAHTAAPAPGQTAPLTQQQAPGGVSGPTTRRASGRAPPAADAVGSVAAQASGRHSSHAPPVAVRSQPAQAAVGVQTRRQSGARRSAVAEESSGGQSPCLTLPDQSEVLDGGPAKVRRGPSRKGRAAFA
ncbi:unnamed protein product [Pedinophyceae sp. YPF-701]|nr:unnamed protein product [Pedinophyceae sp. YPF-701]